MNPFEPLPDDDRQRFRVLFDCPKRIDSVPWALRRGRDARLGRRFFVEPYLASVVAVIADRLRSMGRVRIVDFNLFLPIAGEAPRNIGWLPSLSINLDGGYQLAKSAGSEPLLDLYLSDCNGLMAGIPQEAADCSLQTMMFGRSGDQG